jgi:Domain of unknown function (DUF4157)
MFDRLNITAKKSQNLDSKLKVSPFRSRGFGVQPKLEDSAPASKAELWKNYQQAKQLNQNGANRSSVPIQTKLTIGQPGDKYEQEADSVADRVMAMSEPAQVQREELPEEEELQMKPLADTISPLVQREELREELPEEEELQMKEAATSNTPAATTSLEDRLSSSKAGGSPLSDDVRSFMEPRFGADFSGVRVHTGNDAVQMNQGVNAQAFAHGSDIYFGAGKAPGKDALTAHELTHVVQQTGDMQRKSEMVTEQPQPSIASAPGLQTIQRRGTPRSPNAHVGADPGHYTFLDDGTGDVIAPGDAGYSRRMLSQVGGAAETLSGNYANERLEEVAIPLEGSYTQLRQRAKEKVELEQKAKEYLRIPYATRFDTQSATWCQNHMNEIKTCQDEEKAKQIAFNSWVPRANGFYNSLTRLDAMQDMLGVNDPNSMVTALTQGLHDAGQVGIRAQKAHDAGAVHAERLPIPPTDNSVANASSEITQAAEEMNTAYLGFQQNLLEEEIKETNAEGKLDRQRLQKIQEVKNFTREISHAVDVTMLKMKNAPDNIAKITKILQPPIEGREQTATPSSSISLPTSIKDITGMDVNISLEDITGRVVDFAYASEVKDIEKRLNQITSRCEAISESKSLIAIKERTQKFQNSLTNFKLKCDRLPQQIQKQREAYLDFGVGLDRFASRDADSRRAGQAPADGKERYTTIVTVASQIREVMALSRTVKDGFDTPGQFKGWAQGINVVREKYPPHNDIQHFSVPEPEWQALNRMYGQASVFHNKIGQIDLIFGPVETAARDSIEMLHQGGDNGDYRSPFNDRSSGGWVEK